MRDVAGRAGDQPGAVEVDAVTRAEIRAWIRDHGPATAGAYCDAQGITGDGRSRVSQVMAGMAREGLLERLTNARPLVYGFARDATPRERRTGGREVAPPPAEAKRHDCGAAGMLTAPEIAQRAGVAIRAIYKRLKAGVRGDALMARHLRPPPKPKTPKARKVMRERVLSPAAKEASQRPFRQAVARAQAQKGAPRVEQLCRVELPDTEAFIAANPECFEVLPPGAVSDAEALNMSRQWASGVVV